MINRYYHPYINQTRISSSSSVNAEYIIHPLLFEDKETKAFDEKWKIGDLIPKYRKDDLP